MRVLVISFKLRLITQIVTEVGKLLPSKFHTKSLEVMLIVVPVKEALELEANRMVEDISSTNQWTVGIVSEQVIVNSLSAYPSD
jgi:hypothetical protein